MKKAAMKNIMLRPDTVNLVSGLLRPLLPSGLITAGEFDMINKNLRSLAKNGELAPMIPPRLLTPQEVASQLNISYSQFRALEKEGVFPFRRRNIGKAAVRYLNTEVIDYITKGDDHNEAD